MSRIVDLSGPLFNGMWDYNVLPGLKKRLPELNVERVTTVAEDGFESFRYVLGSTSGTYLETGAHMLAGVHMLSDLDVWDFIKPAVVCHVPRKGPRELICLADLRANCPKVREGDALLIECGWASQWRSPQFVTDGPGFHHDCLPWLLDQPMSLLGVDVPCMEPPWRALASGEPSESMLIPIFKKGILLLAPLVNLDLVRAERGELCALPLRADGVSGAPCRAVFRDVQPAP